MSSAPPPKKKPKTKWLYAPIGAALLFQPQLLYTTVQSTGFWVYYNIIIASKVRKC